MMTSIETIRADFPILQRTVKDHPLAYLDNAASSQKPLAVLQAMDDYYRHTNANVHRGVHTLSEEATRLYEGARGRIGRFINAGSSNLSVTNAGETALLSSVSKLVTHELNRLASGLLKGVDINLGVEAYKPGVDPATGQGGITTEVQLGVSKRLLNDRLTVKVGGNLNVGANGQEQQALTAITGDFALEYQLTPDGNYLLRVYQRSDYDALYEGNVNKAGAGISIRKTFENKERKRKQ